MRHPSQDPGSTLTLRIAGDDDLPSIVRLAALDSARPPKAPVLIAEVDGEICVAVSLADLHSVADPFRLTDDIRAIAMTRARQSEILSGQTRLRRPLLRIGQRPLPTA